MALSLSWLIVGQVFLARFPGITALRLPCRKCHVGSPCRTVEEGSRARSGFRTSTFAFRRGTHDLPRSSTGSPFGTSYGLPLPELNIGYRSKYKRRLRSRAGDCMPLPCWFGDLFMDHKASALLSPTVVSLSLCWLAIERHAPGSLVLRVVIGSFRFHCFRQLIKPAVLMEINSSSVI